VTVPVIGRTDAHLFSRYVVSATSRGREPGAEVSAGGRFNSFFGFNSKSELKTHTVMPSDSLETLHDLFVHELRDLYDAENQLMKALPLMSQAAQSPELKRAFDTHLRETKEQARRIEQVFQGLGEKPSGKSCKAMQGLIAEAKELLEEDADPDVMDAALIVAAQKVEHYEIAGYGSVCTFGRVLGYNDATEILKETVAEEERTDKLLTGIAEKLNPEAKSADEADESTDSSSDDMSDLQAGPSRRAAGSQRVVSNRTTAARRSGGRSVGTTSRSRSGGGQRSRSGGRSRAKARSRR
jgi:ferritin-like metal-binding protein YciE